MRSFITKTLAIVNLSSDAYSVKLKKLQENQFFHITSFVPNCIDAFFIHLSGEYRSRINTCSLRSTIDLFIRQSNHTNLYKLSRYTVKLDFRCDSCSARCFIIKYSLNE